MTALHRELRAPLPRAAARGDALLDSADNPLSAATWAAAWGAVEATLAAADWVAGGRDRVGFAAVRPPGHHAEAGTAMGFCFFDNVAVAAEHLRRRHGCRAWRSSISTCTTATAPSTCSKRAPTCSIASTHQYPFYPGTGAADETGVGAGVGATLNVPLPAGTGDDGYAAAIEGRVLPALRRFAPDMLLLSAGFDAWMRDPLGGMAVSEQGFARWGEWLRRLAGEVCGGRVLAVLEGGYDLRQPARTFGARRVPAGASPAGLKRRAPARRAAKAGRGGRASQPSPRTCSGLSVGPVADYRLWLWRQSIVWLCSGWNLLVVEGARAPNVSACSI